MLVVTHLQECHQVKTMLPWHEKRTHATQRQCVLTISTPPWNMSRPWMSASTASRSCNSKFTVSGICRLVVVSHPYLHKWSRGRRSERGGWGGSFTRWLEGSSRRIMCGFLKVIFANATLLFWPPAIEQVLIRIKKIKTIPLGECTT